MLSQSKQTQRTFAQADYISLLAETFLTAKKAEGRSADSLSFYREKLNIFMAFCEAQAVTQAHDITADFLRRFLLTMAETHNPGGVHAIYRAVRASGPAIGQDRAWPRGA